MYISLTHALTHTHATHLHALTLQVHTEPPLPLLRGIIIFCGATPLERATWLQAKTKTPYCVLLHTKHTQRIHSRWCTQHNAGRNFISFRHFPPAFGSRIYINIKERENIITELHALLLFHWMGYPGTNGLVFPRAFSHNGRLSPKQQQQHNDNNNKGQHEFIFPLLSLLSFSLITRRGFTVHRRHLVIKLAIKYVYFFLLFSSSCVERGEGWRFKKKGILFPSSSSFFHIT